MCEDMPRPVKASTPHHAPTKKPKHNNNNKKQKTYSPSHTTQHQDKSSFFSPAHGFIKQRHVWWLWMWGGSVVGAAHFCGQIGARANNTQLQLCISHGPSRGPKSKSTGLRAKPRPAEIFLAHTNVETLSRKSIKHTHKQKKDGKKKEREMSKKKKKCFGFRVDSFYFMQVVVCILSLSSLSAWMHAKITPSHSYKTTYLHVLLPCPDEYFSQVIIHWLIVVKRSYKSVTPLHRVLWTVYYCTINKETSLFTLSPIHLDSHYSSPKLLDFKVGKHYGTNHAVCSSHNLNPAPSELPANVGNTWSGGPLAC